MPPIVTVFERSPDRDKRQACDMRVRSAFEEQTSHTTLVLFHSAR